MCNWRKWIVPGLISVGLLTLLAGALRSDPVEKDLAARSGTALTAAHPWAAVKLDGRDLTLEGTAPEPEAQTAALKIARDTYGVRIATDATKLLPLAEPYLFSAARDGSKITLTGSVPSEDARKSITDSIAAAIPDAQIADQLALARGAPAGFAGLAGFGLAQLSRLANGNVSLSGSEMSASGLASTLDTWNSVKSAFAGTLPQGGKAGAVDILPPAVAPYSFSAAKDGGMLVLTGHYPDEATRTMLLEAASATGAQVEDKLVPASGAATGFGDLAKFALSQFSMLKAGKAEISDDSLSLAGDATSGDAHAAITAALAGAIPGSGKLASANIVKPLEFGWSYSRTPEGGVLEGVVPDSKTGEELLASAKATILGGMPITDSQVVGEGAPAGFGDAANALVRSVNRLFEGKASIDAGGANISGKAITAAAARELSAALPTALPGNLKASVDIAAAPIDASLSAAECEARFQTVLSANRIQFETASSRISGDSVPLLDTLTFTASQCPTAKFEIGGHTDSDGEDASNFALSNDRAAAVVKYLADAGTDAVRLVAKGYGETVPVGDNTTDAGKAQNRRIEFRVIE